MINSGKREIPPTVIVIFGASGDLTSRKLVPALFNLSMDHLLPNKFFLIGYGRKAVTDQEFRETLKKSLTAHSRRPVDEKIWNNLEPGVSFHQGAYDDPESFEKLKVKIEKIEKVTSEPVQCIFYLSTPLQAFFLY